MGGAERSGSGAPPPFVVVAASPDSGQAAAAWAERHRVPLLERAEAYGSSVPVIEAGPGGLALLTADGGTVSAAALELGAGRRPGRDLLARAALTRTPGGPPSVVDATAGLGADGFHLAALGHRVTLLEREPCLAALLEDALERALEGRLGAEARAAAGRVRLLKVDALDYLSATTEPTDVIYLDPMFPQRGKAALPPKGMAAVRTGLAGREARPEEESALLAAARAHAGRRVVVKRAIKAPPLAGVRPSGSLRGRSVRYDLYATVPDMDPEGSGTDEPPSR